jgi:TonB family protein
LKKQQKPRKFLNLPGYPGGKRAFGEYIRKNMQYPAEALTAGIEGDVLVTYEVTDNGKVLNAVVKHGIGYGCDQEALRLISGMQFGGVSNRGVRVSSKYNTRIAFRLPKVPKEPQLNYHVSVRPKDKDQPTDTPSPGRSYTWQIPLTPHDSTKEKEA